MTMMSLGWRMSGLMRTIRTELRLPEQVKYQQRHGGSKSLLSWLYTRVGAAHTCKTSPSQRFAGTTLTTTKWLSRQQFIKLHRL